MWSPRNENMELQSGTPFLTGRAKNLQGPCVWSTYSKGLSKCVSWLALRRNDKKLQLWSNWLGHHGCLKGVCYRLYKYGVRSRNQAWPHNNMTSRSPSDQQLSRFLRFQKILGWTHWQPTITCFKRNQIWVVSAQIFSGGFKKMYWLGEKRTRQKLC